MSYTKRQEKMTVNSAGAVARSTATDYIAPISTAPEEVVFVDNTSYRTAITAINQTEDFKSVGTITLADSFTPALRFETYSGPVGGSLTGGERVQINNTSPYAYKTAGGVWGTLSDSRLKQSITEINGALDKILTLHPVHYEFINQGDSSNPTGTRTGFIAQEFEQVLPGHTFEMVPMSEADKALLGEGVKAKGIEADLVPYLVKATQELNSKLEQENSVLKQQIAALSARLDALEAK